MSADYVILGIIAAVAITGGIFLLSQAKNYHARKRSKDQHLPHQSAH